MTLLGCGKPPAAGGGRSATVEDWEARIITNGGAVSENTLDYADTFVGALDTAGILSKARRINLCAGDDLAASLTPLINTVGSTSDTGVSMTSGDYSESLGWQTDGANDYINTGYSPSTATGALGVYMRSSLSSGTPTMIGCRNSGFTQYFTIQQSGGGGGWIARWGGTANALYLDAFPSEVGFYFVTRSSSTSIKLHYNDQHGGVTATSVTPADPSASVYVMCSNNAGTAGGFLPSGSRVAGYVIFDDLSDAEEEDLYDALQAFQTSLSRNV